MAVRTRERSAPAHERAPACKSSSAPPPPLIAPTAKAETLLLALTLAHRDELRRLAPLLRALLHAVEAAGR